MRSSLARRAVVSVSAALLLLGPTVHAASATPETPVSSASGIVDQAAHLPAQLVDSLRRDLQLTPEQYLDRSALAQRLAEFAANAQAQFPNAFGGVWIDPDGTPVVGLAADGREAARAATLEAGFTPVDVERSQSELESARTALTDWIATLPPQLAALVDGVTVDVAGNALVLQVADAVADLLDLMPPFLREAARVVLAPALSSLAPTPLGPDMAFFRSTAFLGGDAYTASGGGLGLRCSLGFNAVDRAGAPVNISAGHCDPSPHTAGTEFASAAVTMVGDIAGPAIGHFERTVVAGTDYSVIRPTGATTAQFANNGVRVPGMAPLYITGTADPVVGAPVCKAGSTSGFECGVVTAANRSIAVGEGATRRVIDNGFTTNLCGLRGDSGGPLVTGTLALGIASASNAALHPTCDIARAVTGALGRGPELSATPINAILRANPGLTVRTS